MTETNMGKYEKYLKQLPVIPDVAAKIMSMADGASDISFKELEDTIKVDPGLTAKIPRVANSALYARQREIKSLQMAITLLGLKNIKSLVLLVTASNLMPQLTKKGFYQMFWKHSICTAFLARHITLRCNQKDVADEAFLGGLIHDIGQAAFFNADQARYEQLIDSLATNQAKITDLEREAYGVDHRDLGASILQKWFFPNIFVDIAKEHISPNITLNVAENL